LDINNLLISTNKKTDDKKDDTKKKTNKPHEARDKPSSNCRTGRGCSTMLRTQINVVRHEAAGINEA